MSRRGPDFPWTLAVAALAVVLTALAPDAAIADGRVWAEPWRAATGPFVHATWGHLVRDVCLIAIVGIPYEQPLGRRWLAVLGLGLVIPTIAVLALTPYAPYLGLSGLSHALLAAAIGHELARRRGRARGYVAALAAGFTAKVCYEVATGAPAFPLDLGEVRAVPLAHAAGAVVGYACALARTAGNRASYAATTSPAARSSDSVPVLTTRS